LEEVDPGWKSYWAKWLKVCRSSLYRKPTKQTANDELAKTELATVHLLHPYYGVARWAIDLHWSEKKARRIRNLAGITAMHRSKKSSKKRTAPEVAAPENALRPYIDYHNPEHPWEGSSFSRMAAESGAWVQDFTYINWQGQWVYLAVVVELLTRKILGWSVGLRHTKELVHEALIDALSHNPAPPILHDDQGGEYLSHLVQGTCKRYGITQSCSDKASPWQNGFNESLFRTIKDEVGTPSNYDTIGELYEAIASAIYYYNHERIHTALKMSPVKYAKQLMLETSETLTLISTERVYHREVRH